MLGLPLDTFIAVLCVVAVPLLGYALYRYDRSRRSPASSPNS